MADIILTVNPHVSLYLSRVCVRDLYRQTCGCAWHVILYGLFLAPLYLALYLGGGVCVCVCVCVCVYVCALQQSFLSTNPLLIGDKVVHRLKSHLARRECQWSATATHGTVILESFTAFYLLVNDCIAIFHFDKITFYSI